MISILHAFAVGIAFSIGVVSGAILCGFATRKDRDAFKKVMAENQKRTEERLLAYVLNTGRIADALEKAADRRQS
jgi:hypothetical protein